MPCAVAVCLVPKWCPPSKSNPSSHPLAFTTTLGFLSPLLLEVAGQSLQIKPEQDPGCSTWHLPCGMRTFGSAPPVILGLPGASVSGGLGEHGDAHGDDRGGGGGGQHGGG